MVYFYGKKMKKKAVKAINDTIFYPEKGKDRLLSMIEGRPDYVSLGREFGEFLYLYSLTKNK